MDNFNDAVQFILRKDIEGGLVDDPRDPGGITNMGISLRANPELGREGIINLTEDKAKEIYYRKYWSPLDCDSLPFPTNIFIFDSAVQHGTETARGWLEDSDGDFYKLLSIRMDYYTDLVQMWGDYGRGWMNRLHKLINYIGMVESSENKDKALENLSLIQIYDGPRTINYIPDKTTLGTTNSEEPKLMASVKPTSFYDRLSRLFG